MGAFRTNARRVANSGIRVRLALLVPVCCVCVAVVKSTKGLLNVRTRARHVDENRAESNHFCNRQLDIRRNHINHRAFMDIRSTPSIKERTTMQQPGDGVQLNQTFVSKQARRKSQAFFPRPGPKGATMMWASLLETPPESPIVEFASSRSACSW
jgi:hypothetical protein